MLIVYLDIRLMNGDQGHVENNTKGHWRECSLLS